MHRSMRRMVFVGTVAPSAAALVLAYGGGAGVMAAPHGGKRACKVCRDVNITSNWSIFQTVRPTSPGTR